MPLRSRLFSLSLKSDVDTKESCSLCFVLGALGVLCRCGVIELSIDTFMTLPSFSPNSAGKGGRIVEITTLSLLLSTIWSNWPSSTVIYSSKSLLYLPKIKEHYC